LTIKRTIVIQCPLCHQHGSKAFYSDHRREYRRCPTCALVFVPRSFHLDADQERAEYDQHQNSPEDEGYRRFLSRLSVPLMERLASGSSGLDFGCGPGPTLSVMLEAAGHRVALYDSFYRPDESLLAGCYDFITLTEVIEHLHHPRRELARLAAILKPGGWLGIMTQQVIDQERFRTWRYKDDLTHVCFYSPQTFAWTAEWLQLSLALIGNDVILMQKAISGAPSPKRQGGEA
jgi:SAM-dependent methyltransferase